MEFDNFPYICAECVYLDLHHHLSDCGEERFFYHCEKRKIYVDARDMIRRCEDRRKREDHEETLLALRGLCLAPDP